MATKKRPTQNRKKTSRFSRLSGLSRRTKGILSFVVVFAVLGVILLLRGHANPSLPSGPAVASWQSGMLDVFTRGNDGAIWHRWTFDGGASWSGWQSLGGYCTSGPAVKSWGANRIDLFCRGGDNNIYHKAFTGSWGNWENWSSPFGSNSGPAVASWGPGHLDVFIIGSDGHMWHRYMLNYTLSPGWSSLGGGFSSSPAAVSWGSGRIDVVARGLDNAIWHAYFQNGWSGWESLGGYATQGPAITSMTAGHLEIFVPGGDSQMYHKYYWFGWSGWAGLSGLFTSSPGAVSWGNGRMDVVGLGTDYNVYHTYYDGSWGHGWGNLGGNQLPPPAPTPPPASLNGAYSGPSGPVGGSVACTQYSYTSGCVGSWVVIHGGPQVYYDTNNAQGAQVPNFVYIDDTTPPCSPANNGEQSCLNNLVQQAHNSNPSATIWVAVPTYYQGVTTINWRFSNATAIYEAYPAFSGTNTTACGGQGYIVQRYFQGLNSNGSPIVGTTSYSGFPTEWSSASACNGAADKVLAWW